MRLIRDGFRVYAGVRGDEDGLGLIREGGDAIAPVLLDITNADHVRAAAARIDDETGERGLQALVNNAGVAIAGPLEFLPLDELRRQLEINVIAQIAVTQAFLPLLRRARAGANPDHRAGRIVFMSSIAGRSAMPFTGAYAASKFALEAVADALRIELHPSGIRVAVVEPGIIMTPIWETARTASARNIERMGPRAQEFYGRALAALDQRVANGMKGLPPEKVAETVSHALTSRRPRIRYLVGLDAKTRVWLQRLLPAGLTDRIVLAALRRL
jgi:NAD(P)-dependent dehydrogenase (short-subunit alcohol dehydrogenase family)